MPKKIDGIKIGNEIAEMKGGKLLSTEYINSNTKMLWRCEEGHEWQSRLNHVKNSNSWCPYCASCKIENPIQEAREIAKNKGGKLLSNEYININTKMLWECV